MQNNEIELMRDAMHEIRVLRQQNTILAAKVEVFDSMMCLLHATPATRNQGASIDVAWQLQKAIEAAEAEAASTTPFCASNPE